MRRIGLLEMPRFAWYFLVTKRSPRQFRSGCACCAKAAPSTSTAS